VHGPTQGEIRLQDQPVQFASPRDALDRGIATVYQDLAMVPLMSATEVAVPGAPQHCIRVLMLWNTSRSQQEVVHVYLRGATALRPDLKERRS